MKAAKFLQRVLSAVALMSMAVACNKSDDSDGSSAVTFSEEDQAIMENWVDNVVLVTYEDLDNKALALQSALETLRDSPSQTHFNAAKAAWIAVRIPWEQSEGFISGPVNGLGLDPAMDSWPVKPEDIAGAVADVSGTQIIDVSSLNTDLKGFHAIEYLLYGDAGSKTFASQSDEERSYLVSLAADIHSNTSLLIANWKDSFESGPSYRTQFMNSGVKDPAPYVSTSIAIDHIVERMAFIADEVMATKIAGPHNKDPESAIESEYSDNSLADFQDNIRSILNVYRGSVGGEAAENSISARIKAKDASLDDEVETVIADSIAAIAAIPGPFRTSAVDAEGSTADQKITAAEDKLGELFELLNIKVRAAAKQ